MRDAVVFTHAAANDELLEEPREKRSTMWVHTWFGDFNVTPRSRP